MNGLASILESNLFMQDFDYLSHAPQIMEQLNTHGGAFLTVKAGSSINTMTIGWITLGIVWKKPILSVLVRNSRHTFPIMEQAKDFTVSIPCGTHKKELAFCGSKSGRHCDKFKECNLELVSAQTVSSPVIKIPAIQFECEIVYKTAMDPKHLVPAYDAIYPQKDYHTIYYGEIKKCYKA